MKRKIEASQSDFIVDASQVAAIRNSDVATYLVRDTSDAVEDLQQIAPSIQLDEIHIDSDGSVVIKNEEFLAFVKNAVANPIAPVGDFYCPNFGCDALL